MSTPGATVAKAGLPAAGGHLRQRRPEPWSVSRAVTGASWPLGQLTLPPEGSSNSPDSWRYPPINIIYQHFHDSIRAELGRLAGLACDLERATGSEVEVVLRALKERYQFMEQVYRYHSSVEDEVQPP